MSAVDHPPRRVLFLTPQPFFQWRGSPIRVGFNVRALAELGYEVDLLAMPVGEDREIPGVRLRRAPNVLGVKRLPIGPSPAKAVLDVFLFFTAWRLARQRRYAVIHGVEEAGALAVLLARLTGGNVVYEKHSDPASYRRGPVRNLVMRMYSAVERFTVRRADAVIGTGAALAEQARAAGPRGSVYHIFDIPSSLAEAKPQDIAAARAGYLEDRAGLLVLYVGSFAVYQGIDLMFEAMARVLQRQPGVRLVVIGGSDEEIAARKAWLQGRGIEPAVTFPGHIDPEALPNHLAAADVLLSPRIAGLNTPLKLLDYLKAGRAIVATDHPANRLILDETCSILVPPEAGGLALGVEQALADAGLRERLGRRGREMIRDTYNFPKFKQQLAACYERLPNPG